MGFVAYCLGIPVFSHFFPTTELNRVQHIGVRKQVHTAWEASELYQHIWWSPSDCHCLWRQVAHVLYSCDMAILLAESPRPAFWEYFGVIHLLISLMSARDYIICQLNFCFPNTHIVALLVGWQKSSLLVNASHDKYILSKLIKFAAFKVI